MRRATLLLTLPLVVSACYRSHRIGDPDGSIGVDARVDAGRSDAGTLDVDGLIQLSVGEAHACALRRSGTVVCWGEGGDGQVGQGLETNADVPLTVDGLPRMVRVAAEGGHTCAVAEDGSVFCWGRNNWRQITGDGPRYVERPQQLAVVEDVVDVAVATRHTCVVRADGSVACRGSPLEGQFAETSERDRGWAAIGGIETALQIEAHDKATCIRAVSGRVMCWGGLVGHSGTSRIYRRTPVVLDIDALDVSVGRGDAIGLGEECAVERDGGVVCWERYLGGVPIGTPEPRAVPGLTDAVEVSVGQGFACARRTTGEVACWGRNFAGQLGDGTNENASRPQAVVGLADAVAISLGANHACAIRRGGRLVCWGRNDRGQLGIASAIENSNVPVDLELP